MKLGLIFVVLAGLALTACGGDEPAPKSELGDISETMAVISGNDDDTQRFRFLLPRFVDRCPDILSVTNTGDMLAFSYKQLSEAGLEREEGLLDISNNLYFVVSRVHAAAERAEAASPKCAELFAMYLVGREEGQLADEAKDGVIAIASALYRLVELEAPTTSPSSVEDEDGRNPKLLTVKEPPGIGVSRQAIQSLYEQPDIGFNFESSELADGTPRVIGESPDGFAFLELIGPERDITKATIMVAMPSDDPGAIVMNAAYMLGLLKNLVPNWSGGGDWLAEHFAVAADEGEARTIQGNVDITLTAYKELGMVLLTLESIEGLERKNDQSGNENRRVSNVGSSGPTQCPTVPESSGEVFDIDYSVGQEIRESLRELLHDPQSYEEEAIFARPGLSETRDDGSKYYTRIEIEFRSKNPSGGVMPGYAYVEISEDPEEGCTVVDATLSEAESTSQPTTIPTFEEAQIIHARWLVSWVDRVLTERDRLYRLADARDADGIKSAIPEWRRLFQEAPKGETYYGIEQEIENARRLMLTAIKSDNPEMLKWMGRMARDDWRSQWLGLYYSGIHYLEIVQECAIEILNGEKPSSMLCQ